MVTKAQVDQYNTISFDIFNMILFREYSEPQQLFTAFGEYISDKKISVRKSVPFSPTARFSEVEAYAKDHEMIKKRIYRSKSDVVSSCLQSAVVMIK